MKLNKIITLLAVAAIAAGMPSCSDDTPATPLETTQGAPEGVTYNSLSFQWEKVNGATQYGYELYDSNDMLVVRSVTGQTSVTISDLKPDTEYTLKVWSYAAIGSDRSTSDPIVLKATTLALKAIGSPTLSYSVKSGKYVISWKSVANATEYSYVLTNSAGNTVKSGTTTSKSVSFSNLEIGDYTVAVKALSSKGGYEAEGESSTLSFTAEDLVLWEVEGTYRSEILGQSWTATIVCYGDNNYSIKGWYGVEGYDLDFAVDNITDPDDTFSLTGGYEYDNSSGCYIVPTGRTDLKNIYLYQWWNYSLFSGGKSGGSVKLFVYSDFQDDYVTDLFTWKDESVVAPADDFVGSWNATFSGISYLDEKDAEPFSETKTITITKVDDTTISMPAFNFKDDTMTVHIDMSTMTLTVDPMTVYMWYTLASSQSDSTPVVGRINDDGSFEFTGWNVWYDGWPYLDNTTAKYSK